MSLFDWQAGNSSGMEMRNFLRVCSKTGTRLLNFRSRVPVLEQTLSFLRVHCVSARNTRENCAQRRRVKRVAPKLAQLEGLPWCASAHPARALAVTTKPWSGSADRCTCAATGAKCASEQVGWMRPVPAGIPKMRRILTQGANVAG